MVPFLLAQLWVVSAVVDDPATNFSSLPDNVISRVSGFLGYQDNGAAHLRAANRDLHNDAVIVYLDLSERNLGRRTCLSPQMQALAKALPRMHALVKLDIRGNSVCEAGAHALAEVLPQVQLLVELDISFNWIGDAGAQALGRALPQIMKALATLNIGGNDIFDAGAQALAEALPQMKALATLNINCNRIGEAGPRALAQVLPRMHAVVKLDSFFFSPLARVDCSRHRSAKREVELEKIILSQLSKEVLFVFFGRL